MIKLIVVIAICFIALLTSIATVVYSKQKGLDYPIVSGLIAGLVTFITVELMVFAVIWITKVMLSVL